MSKYTIPCSKEQIEKSLKLGAEEEYLTAEEMIGWLEDQGIAIDIHTYFNVSTCRISKHQYTVNDMSRIFTNECPSRKDAIITAINVALEYLESK